MQKILKIILTILLLIAIILVVVWFRSRQAAIQHGQSAPTFRQFLGLGTATPKQQTTTSGSELTSDFTTPTDTTTPNTGDVTTGAGNTQTSQFTSGPISPTQSNTTPTTTTPQGTKTPNGTPVPGTDGKAIAIPAPNDVKAPAATPNQASSQCTDTDTTIQFTAEEINRLNTLQNRFYAIAGMLHTDADVQNEVANHDEFKAKVDQITELYNYCVAKAPLITAPLYSTRITTPFFRDASRDGSGYWWNRPLGATFIDLSNNTQDPQNPMMSQASIEQIFKLNLW